jgi:hypothetical protein
MRHFDNPEDIGWPAKFTMDVDDREFNHPVGFLYEAIKKAREDKLCASTTILKRMASSMKSRKSGVSAQSTSTPRRNTRSVRSKSKRG